MKIVNQNSQNEKTDGKYPVGRIKKKKIFSPVLFRFFHCFHYFCSA